MGTKHKSFNAYQIDLHYLDDSRHATDAVKWESDVMVDILNHIFNNLNEGQRTARYNDVWLMYLDHFEHDEHFIFGSFSSAEYGTIGELIHADDLTRRPNPKEIREGETESTYFIIRKSDGLMLLQVNQRLKRVRVDEYIERYGHVIINNANLTYLQICTLVETNFFNSIRELNTVHRIEIEVAKVETMADENEAVQALQGDLETISATTVKLKFEAKYQRSGLSGAIGLVKKYKDQPGVTKMVVRGKLAGAEKKINLEESQEKYTRRVEVDSNNQPMLSSIEVVLREIANSRRLLRG
ncbi:hypothetical protein [Paenibacillus shenyangensis]|uniref:hypothetical protein n=1 Tax=Paenibacillus sp. A9 TaxID=1284352 RepID=UPI00035E20B2|nr:hypothetical protein [Paenibacillus sp. A9]